jgi:hypothetical protein
MNVREKLVEMRKEAAHYAICTCSAFQNCEDCPYRKYGTGCRGNIEMEYLLKNGVTVQEEAKLYWKPVEPGVWNLTCSACDSHLGCREDANFCPECGAKFVRPKAVMPQPPKGE